MRLKLFYAKKEDVPEAFVEHYAEQDDGRWMLQGDGIVGDKDVANLKSALAKEREDNKAGRSKLKKFADAGIDDPAAAAEAVKKLAEFDKLDPEKDAEKLAAEKMKIREAQIVAKHNEELTGRDTERDTLMTQLNEVMIRADATAAIAEHKGSVPLLLPMVQKITRLSQENGKFFVEVLGADGNPRIGDASGKLMTISQLVEEMKGDETYGRAFDGEGRSGSGGPGDGGGKPIEGKVSINDQEGLNANFEAIAEGTVTVTE